MVMVMVMATWNVEYEATWTMNGECACWPVMAVHGNGLMVMVGFDFTSTSTSTSTSNFQLQRTSASSVST